jgi:alpha-tubulin suppressor-like RCC1 family protein
VLLGAAAALVVAAGGPSANAASQRWIAAGGEHTCMAQSGAVECWGANDSGQLGDGTETMRLTPAPVVGLAAGVEALTAGRFHTCALLTGGTVSCWGDNRFGQLGDGTGVDRSRPTPVVGLSGPATAIAAGSFHTCALIADGNVECWGDNTTAQLADPYLDESRVPQQVDGLPAPATAIASGTDHTCALLLTGAVDCWGWNLFGQLGYGDAFTVRILPVPVIGITGALNVDGGFAHTCAVTAAGGVDCWGLNASGQVGDGTTKDRAQPVQVVGESGGVTAIASGYFYNCALAAGTVSCWGRNAADEMGDGKMVDRKTPVPVEGLDGVEAIAAGGYHTCALLSPAGFRCWGSNHYGQLGNGRKTNELELNTRGQGSIDAFGVRCRVQCWAERPPGAKITMLALPAKGWRLASWTGACKSKKARCVFRLAKDGLVVAHFARRR